ncbi:MAG: hypothetical protein HND52_12330 [Ignavibacteriae bacterium]|nr:hypothetical protein [Ignavibacteriota bacterium]NOG98738.1 hypothetical protein [Ignavibacteriota bacterium]
MIKEVREKFNAEFDEIKFKKFIDDIQRSTDNNLDFKICETPLFIDEDLTQKLIEASHLFLDEINTEEFKQHSKNAVPENLIVPNENDHPHFLQIDFGITTDENGEYLPQVIELQGFPSLYAYQAFLDKEIKKHFNIPDYLSTYFNDLDFESYIKLFRDMVIGNSDPQNVILLEIDPWNQKTRIDFYLTEKYLGIKTVCLTEIEKEGKNLFYNLQGKRTKIERIYNRVIFDELLNKNIQFNFDFRDELNVEWITHPNWFYRISKHSLPFFKNKYSPECYFLNEINTLPSNLKEFVLKPLFSFAGSGVIVDIETDALNKIEDQQNYILQKKVEYAPIIKTPEGYSKAEIRMMFLWDKKPILVNNLLRTSKGKMMGVDFNKNQTWIGSSIVYHK